MYVCMPSSHFCMDQLSMTIHVFATFTYNPGMHLWNTKSHPNTLQLYISPAGGGCFPHSRRILEAVELAGAAGAAGAAARLEPARGDATGVGRGEFSQPNCWVAACTRRNRLKEPKDPKMHCRATHAYLLWCHVSQFFLEIHL